MKRSICLLIFLHAAALGAQPRQWTLDECMEYAVENSPKAKKQQYTNNDYRQDRTQAIAAMLPAVGASVDAGWGFGRGIDPATNTYGTTANFNNYYSMTASMPLFNGFANINALRAANIARLRGDEELQQVEDAVAMETMQAFYDVLYYKGAVGLAGRQLDESRANLSRTAKMAELGLKVHADVAQVEAQAAADEFNLTQQQNLLETSLLKLKDCMNYPFGQALELSDDARERFYAAAADRDEIYGYAKQNLPQSLIAQYQMREAELGYLAAKGRQLPNIYASAGYSTNYFHNMTSGEATENFRNQFRNNAGESVGITMSIPIFNGLQRRAAINRSRNALRIAEQTGTQAERQLQSEIAQAVLDVEGLSKEYAQAIKRSAAYEEAHKANQRKFEQGTLSALELQTSANQLLLSRATQLQTRLNYLMRSRLLEFYEGRPLIRK